MLFKDYIKTIECAEEPKDVKCGYSCCPCVFSMIRRIPLAVLMIKVPGLEVIKLPRKALNKWGDEVNVSGFMSGVFQENVVVTDIILHSGINDIPESAFRGCKSLKRITIPKLIRKISAMSLLDVILWRISTSKAPRKSGKRLRSIRARGSLNLENRFPELRCVKWRLTILSTIRETMLF